MKKKLAIIGASYLQRPLVEKAKEMGLETHVFAWREGNEVDDISDYYYPISILEKEEILAKCKEIDIDGITSIASDIAMPTVNYIAEKLNLVGNSIAATTISTDKFEMRKALINCGVSCPKFKLYTEPTFNEKEYYKFPVIVKPTDRSGSRGVTKVQNPENVNEAISKALKNSINGRAIVEEFIEGREFSVEFISFKGEHEFLAITDKVTTGAPYFVEIEHHQPAAISDQIKEKIIAEVQKSLKCLNLVNGASHSEVLLTKDGEVKVVEIAGRMGGELIGSHMVPLATGVDFVKAVVKVALGEFNLENFKPIEKGFSGVYYVIPKAGTISKIIDNSHQYSDIVF
ncbi:ATP-grasp domain-containing protein, partial [Balneolaceae bacterium YR4-1]